MMMKEHGPKIGGSVLLFWGGAGSPSNTMLPRPTSVPRFIFIHPAVWPQYTNVTDRTNNALIHRANRFTNGRPKTVRPMLPDSCPVCNVGVLWPNGWMD